MEGKILKISSVALCCYWQSHWVKGIGLPCWLPKRRQVSHLEMNRANILRTGNEDVDKKIHLKPRVDFNEGYLTKKKDSCDYEIPLDLRQNLSYNQLESP